MNTEEGQPTSAEIQGSLVCAFVRHGEAKNTSQARALLQRQQIEQHFLGTEATLVGLHSNEQGLEVSNK